MTDVPSGSLPVESETTRVEFSVRVGGIEVEPAADASRARELVAAHRELDHGLPITARRRQVRVSTTDWSEEQPADAVLTPQTVPDQVPEADQASAAAAVAAAADALPPAAYLLCETLAARHRLGEPFWPFPSKLRSVLNRLQRDGWISHEASNTPRARRAWLTDKGRQGFMTDTYTPRLTATDVPHIVAQVRADTLAEAAAAANQRADEHGPDEVAEANTLIALADELTWRAKVAEGRATGGPSAGAMDPCRQPQTGAER